MSRILLAGLSALFIAHAAHAADASLPNETPEQYEKRVKWFRDAKVGVFIHWNPSVIIEREISWCRNEVGKDKYDALYKRFDPKRFNADEWIRIFHDAGIRYAVFVPKHHDGFAMFRTKTYDYNVLNTPFGRDYTKELADACRKGGVRFCLYYSVLDWWNKDYSPKAGTDLTNYVEKTFKPQIRELLTQYGPVGCIWFDGNWDASWKRSHALEIAQIIRQLQPELMIGNRLEPKARRPGPELMNSDEPGVRINGDLPYVSSFYDAPDAVGDYQAREMMYGHYYADKAWDSCYNFAPTPAAPNGAWSWLAGAKPRPLSEIVHWIIQCIGRDGNALLGIGPKPDGTIDAASAVRLKELGAWLRANGDAVYETRGGPWTPGEWGVSTRKGDKVFLFIERWSGESLKLPSLGLSVKSARVLGGSPVNFTETSGNVVLRVPAGQRKPIATVIELTLSGDVMKLPVKEVPGPRELSVGKSAEVSSFWAGRPELDKKHITDGNGGTMWAAEEKARSGSITIDLGQPAAVSGVRLSDAPYGRTRKFDIEVEVGSAWKKVAFGTTIGDGNRLSFDAVTTSRVRLNIREASDTPTIAEMTVLGE